MHPILFKIGDFPISTYGVMIVIGMVAGLWLAARIARRQDLRPDFFYDLTFVLLISGFLGARFFSIVLSWEAFVDDPMAVLFSRQGFVFLGGFLVAVPTGIWYTHHRKMPLADTVDVVAPGLVLAHAFGRIGCFLAGCCHGVACGAGSSLAWLGVQYPLVTDAAGKPLPMFNFAYWSQMDDGLISMGALAPLPIVPVQLFESTGNALICLGLLWLWRRRRFSSQIFAAYMGAYSVLRFSLEFLRGDTARGMWMGGTLSTSQLISIGVMVAAIALWLWRRDKGFVEVDPAARLSTFEAEAAAEKQAAEKQAADADAEPAHAGAAPSARRRRRKRR